MNRVQSQAAVGDSIRVRHRASASRRLDIFHAASEEQSQFQLNVRRSLKMHGRLALGVALVGFLLSAIYLWRYWPVYSAEAVVYIQPAPAVEAGSGAPMHWPYNYDPATYESYVQQQMLSMTRQDVLKGALDKLENFERSGETDQDAADRLRLSLNVEREGNSYEVTIRAQAPRAQMAADIANAVASSYIENTLQEQRASDAARIAVLRDEAERIKKELDDDRAGQTALASGVTPPVAGSGQKSIDSAEEIARLQSRYDVLDEQLQNLSIADASPGTAHVAAAAIAPTHPIADGVVRNAAILLGVFLLLALLSALAAHRLDPRVYAASDLEEILGFRPIAELPDSDEVSQDVFEEQMLRLSAAIESMLKPGELTSCVFTGACKGAGVSMIATQVRSLIEGMGRFAVLVGDEDGQPAVWPRSAANIDGFAEGRPLAIVQRLREEARVREGMVVLADAAPLTLSAETEYLVRNTECVVVVVKSGVTTRTELRATAKALQRLDVGVVGYVLNRIEFATADAEFKDSLSVMERYLRTHRRRSKPEPVRTRLVEAEAAQYFSEPAPMNEPDLPVVPERVMEEEIPFRAPSALRGRPLVEGPTIAVAGPAPLAEQQPPKVRSEVATAAKQKAPAASPIPKQETLPWWLNEPFVHTEVAEQAPDAPQPATRADVETAASIERESRLSGLRKLFVERNAAISQGISAPTSNIPSVSAQERAEVPVTERVVPTAREPQAEYESSSPGRRATPKVKTVPEFLPPRTPGGTKRDEDAASRRDRRDTWDDVSVLPSWRGQYRRKE